MLIASIWPLIRVGALCSVIGQMSDNCQLLHSCLLLWPQIRVGALRSANDQTSSLFRQLASSISITASFPRKGTLQSGEWERVSKVYYRLELSCLGCCPTGFNDLCFHTYGEFSPPTHSPPTYPPPRVPNSSLIPPVPASRPKFFPNLPNSAKFCYPPAASGRKGRRKFPIWVKA